MIENIYYSFHLKILPIGVQQIFFIIIFREQYQNVSHS